MKGYWLKNCIKNGIEKENENRIKPCRELGYCPYGSLIEEFPIGKDIKYLCKTFGHNCPVFYCAEDIKIKNGKESLSF
ncbi:MAG: hypothetical protein KKD48_01960 [Nanoarchaeota archaeon]|nr:hypothetical protein [Nanoarchaeota archaeon]